MQINTSQPLSGSAGAGGSAAMGLLGVPATGGGGSGGCSGAEPPLCHSISPPPAASGGTAHSDAAARSAAEQHNPATQTPPPLTPIGSRMQPTPRCKTSGKQRPLPALPSAEKLRASLRYFVLYFNTCVRSHRAKPTQPGESEQPNTERGRGWARTCRDQPRGRQRRIRKKHRINKLINARQP